MNDTIKIRDVASLAQVSASTVSNVLNGRYERMRPETKARVLRAIDQLGYTPSQLARQLKTGQVRIIGLIVPSVANPFWGIVARNVESVAAAAGYQVLLCNAERDPVRERHYAETLWASGVRGVIFGSSPITFDHLAKLARQGLRVVAFDRQSQRADQVVLDSVGVDNVQGARVAVEHLLTLGHRRIGFISGPIRTISRLDRLEGYRQALHDAGIVHDPALIWEGSSLSAFGDTESVELGRTGARELLSKPDAPTAIVTINDMYAFGAYAGARDLGLTVPADVSIVGFDDLAPLAEIAIPPLTTVRQPLHRLMRIAVEQLIGRIEETRTGEPEHVSLPPELVVRSSTAAISLRVGKAGDGRATETLQAGGQQ